MAKQRESEERPLKLAMAVDKIFVNNAPIYEKMERFLKRYKGQWWNTSANKDNEALVYANYIFSTVETIAPLLTDNRPIWSVRARQSFMQNRMEAFSLALEYLWDKIGLDMKVLAWVKDALIMKVGIMKAYWDPKEKEVVNEVVDPRTFFIANGYTSLKEAPMCGQRMKKPMSWVRFKYPEKWKMVKPDGGTPIGFETMADWELEEHPVTVYEVWLKDSTVEEYFVNEQNKEIDKSTEGAQKKTRKKFPNGKIITMTKAVMLEEKASIPVHGLPPYVELYDYTIPHEFFGGGEADQIEEMNLSFNRGLQLLHTWLTFYSDPPWIMDPNSGLPNSDEVKKQLKAGGAVFEANTVGGDEPLRKIDGPQVNPTVLSLMQALTKLMEEVSGQPDVTKGIASKSQRQSATEVSTLSDFGTTRTRQRVRNLEDSLKRLLYINVSLMEQFYGELREFQVNVDGQPARMTVSNRNDFARASIRPPDSEMELMSPDEAQQVMRDYHRFIEQFGETDPIHAAFDIVIETNSTLPMDKQSRANEFLRLLELGNANPITSVPIWKATLKVLQIPEAKKIIAEIEQLMQQQAAAEAPQNPTSVQGPPPVSQLVGGTQ